MNKKFILPIIIMLALVVMLSGLMSLQAGQAQEDSDPGDLGPMVEEPATVTQKADSSPAKQTTVAYNNSSQIAPAPAPTSAYYGGGGGFAASSAEEEEDDDKSITQTTEEQTTPIVVAIFSYETDCLNVNFNDLSENATSFYWDFGDGNTSIADSPEYLYSAAGEYTVNLTVSNGDYSDSTEKVVIVEECTEDSKIPEEQPEGPENIQEEIPEFPTVALPMVAIIGMAFFFSRRQ